MTRHTDRYYKDLARFKGYKHPLWGVMSFHHFGYRHLKNRYSIYWIDGVYLPTWFHTPIIHTLLGGGKPSSQLFGKFPNPVQRVAHWICRIHWGIIPLGFVWAVIKLGLIS